jgi:hypothetical protein
MDFNLKIFKDAAEAIDKIVDAVEKLGKMLYASASTASEVLERQFAKSALGRLRAISVSSTYLVQGRCSLLLASMDNYLKTPDAAKWEDFQQNVQTTVAAVQGLSDDIKGSSKEIATTDFFPVLVGAVAQRQLYLVNFTKMKPPTTPEEIEAARELILKYETLLTVLSEATKQLGHYIEALEAKKP